MILRRTLEQTAKGGTDTRHRHSAFEPVEWHEGSRGSRWGGASSAAASTISCADSEIERILIAQDPREGEVHAGASANANAPGTRPVAPFADVSDSQSQKAEQMHSFRFPPRFVARQQVLWRTLEDIGLLPSLANGQADSEHACSEYGHHSVSGGSSCCGGSDYHAGNMMMPPCQTSGSVDHKKEL